jgi:hypothetical protein
MPVTQAEDTPSCARRGRSSSLNAASELGRVLEINAERQGVGEVMDGADLLEEAQEMRGRVLSLTYSLFGPRLEQHVRVRPRTPARVSGSSAPWLPLGGDDQT